MATRRQLCKDRNFYPMCLALVFFPPMHTYTRTHMQRSNFLPSFFKHEYDSLLAENRRELANDLTTVTMIVSQWIDQIQQVHTSYLQNMSDSNETDTRRILQSVFSIFPDLLHHVLPVVNHAHEKYDFSYRWCVLVSWLDAVNNWNANNIHISGKLMNTIRNKSWLWTVVRLFAQDRQERYGVLCDAVIMELHSRIHTDVETALVQQNQETTSRVHYEELLHLYVNAWQQEQDSGATRVCNYTELCHVTPAQYKIVARFMLLTEHELVLHSPRVLADLLRILAAEQDVAILLVMLRHKQNMEMLCATFIVTEQYMREWLRQESKAVLLFSTSNETEEKLKKNTVCLLQLLYCVSLIHERRLMIASRGHSQSNALDTHELKYKNANYARRTQRKLLLHYTNTSKQELHVMKHLCKNIATNEQGSLTGECEQLLCKPNLLVSLCFAHLLFSPATGDENGPASLAALYQHLIELLQNIKTIGEICSCLLNSARLHVYYRCGSFAEDRKHMTRITEHWLCRLLCMPATHRVIKHSYELPNERYLVLVHALLEEKASYQAMKNIVSIITNEPERSDDVRNEMQSVIAKLVNDTHAGMFALNNLITKEQIHVAIEWVLERLIQCRLQQHHRNVVTPSTMDDPILLLQQEEQESMMFLQTSMKNFATCYAARVKSQTILAACYDTTRRIVSKCAVKEIQDFMEPRDV